MEAKSSVLLLAAALVAATAMVDSSHAYDFYVGGRQGWVQNPSESYNSWAGRSRFQVGDRLVFRYRKEEDSVLVVNEEDYRACNTANPIRKLDDSGDSVFQFDRSGPFFFISGIAGRCQAGEKLVVVVLAVRGGPKPAAPPPLPTATPSPLSSPPSAAPQPSPSAGPSPSPSKATPSPAPSPSEPQRSPSPAPSPFTSPTISPAGSPPPAAAGGPGTAAPAGGGPSSETPPSAPQQAPSGTSSLRPSFGTAAAAAALALAGAALLSP